MHVSDRRLALPLSRAIESDCANGEGELSRTGQRALGAYYTPTSAASYMVNWAVRARNERILEPSFGDGIFLRQLRDFARARDWPELKVEGHEIDGAAAARAVKEGLLGPFEPKVGDYLSLAAGHFDVVIGNPPYVRLRALPARERQTALQVADQALGIRMETSGSVWMPFVLKAASQLTTRGRMALVLPWEMTHVRYARPLWKYLCNSFGNLRVVRVKERLFAGLSQDVILLFADERGSTTDHLRFETFETVADLVADWALSGATLKVDEVLAGDRVFQRALIPDAVREVALRTIETSTMKVGDTGAFNVGYVTGNKRYFHPERQTREDFNLPASSLFPAVTDARTLRGGGLYTSELRDPAYLWRPSPTLTGGENAYVKQGVVDKVHEAYKCAVREPWYIVPGVRTPDVLISVFTDRPTAVVNDGALKASNSLICGFLKTMTPLEFVGRWYSTLTLLSIETEVHALGGGVLVLVPNETSAIRMPADSASGKELNDIHAALKEGDTLTAYLARDEGLCKTHGVDVVDAISTAVEALATWRRRPKGESIRER